MKIYRTTVNPAFKQTQPLPVLPANFAGRAGRAAAAFTWLIRSQGAFSPVALPITGCAATVRSGFNPPVLSLMG